MVVQATVCLVQMQQQPSFAGQIVGGGEGYLGGSKNGGRNECSHGILGLLSYAV